MGDDKPFVCSAMGCGMRFTNEDHLAVHTKKHEMSLALNNGPPANRSPSGLFLDQTPTPTKFLRIGEEIGLFQELSKNPFDEAFKKASDVPEHGASEGIPFPGPLSNELHTPVPPGLKTVEEIPEAHSGVLRYIKQEPKFVQSPKDFLSGTNDGNILSATALDLSSPKHPTPPKLMKIQQPSSTTTDDEDITPVSSTQVDLTSLSSAGNETAASVSSTVTICTDTSTVTKMLTATTVTAAQSTTTSPPKMTTVLQQASAIVPQTHYTMQVYLQLPNGQTVPVQVPAAISAPGIQMAVPTAVIQKAATPTTSAAMPTHVAVMPTQTAQSPIPQSTLTKQKLKAAIQHQAIPCPTNMKLSQLPTATPVAHVAQFTRMSPEITNHIITPHTSSPVMMDSASIVSDTSTSPDTEAGYSVRHKRFSEEDADERRTKFLERNRAAAARCRQKRKYWITSLEKKAEELQSTNSRLQGEVNSLRNEVAQLKVLLLEHKDCPITLQQHSTGQVPIQTISVVEPSSGIVVNTTTRSSVPTEAVTRESVIGTSISNNIDSVAIVIPTILKSDSSPSSVDSNK